jgi:hypothetical protein
MRSMPRAAAIKFGNDTESRGWGPALGAAHALHIGSGDSTQLIDPARLSAAATAR